MAPLIFLSWIYQPEAAKPLQYLAEEVSGPDTLEYLFVGHTYHAQPGTQQVDSRLIQLDKSRYSRIWLGGDICSETFLDENSVAHIDDVFDLGALSTQFALGNHDVRNGNMHWYTEYCGRETYNFYSKDKVVSVCLNSMLNPGRCEELNAQFRMLKRICDTITESRHLFVFHHAGLWGRISELPPQTTYAHSDFKYWNANCDSSGTYYDVSILPLLRNVTNRGIKVYCIMGDVGAAAKSFYQQTSDSIHYFGSGLQNSKYMHDTALFNSKVPDSVLIFSHCLSDQTVSWKFHGLDSLINAQ